MGALASRNQVSLTDVLESTMDILRKLHVVHEKTAFEELLESKLPGSDITVANLVNNLFEIVKPVIAEARKRFPALFAVIDWAQEIVRKLLKH